MATRLPRGIAGSGSVPLAGPMLGGVGAVEFSCANPSVPPDGFTRP